MTFHKLENEKYLIYAFNPFRYVTNNLFIHNLQILLYNLLIISHFYSCEITCRGLWSTCSLFIFPFVLFTLEHACFASPEKMKERKWGKWIVQFYIGVSLLRISDFWINFLGNFEIMEEIWKIKMIKWRHIIFWHNNCSVNKFVT